MMILRIQGATRVFGAPVDWDEAKQGPCGALAIRDELIDGVRFMASAWELSPDEIAALQAGAPLILRIAGTNHPVVSLCVGEAP